MLETSQGPKFIEEIRFQYQNYKIYQELTRLTNTGMRFTFFPGSNGEL